MLLNPLEQLMTSFYIFEAYIIQRELTMEKICSIDIFEEFNNILRMICRIYQKNELTLHSKYK